MQESSRETNKIQMWKGSFVFLNENCVECLRTTCRRQVPKRKSVQDNYEENVKIWASACCVTETWSEQNSSPQPRGWQMNVCFEMFSSDSMVMNLSLCFFIEIFQLSS